MIEKSNQTGENNSDRHTVETNTGLLGAAKRSKLNEETTPGDTVVSSSSLVLLPVSHPHLSSHDIALNLVFPLLL